MTGWGQRLCILGDPVEGFAVFYQCEADRSRAAACRLGRWAPPRSTQLAEWALLFPRTSIHPEGGNRLKPMSTMSRRLSMASTVLAHWLGAFHPALIHASCPLLQPTEQGCCPRQVRRRIGRHPNASQSRSRNVSGDRGEVHCLGGSRASRPCFPRAAGITHRTAPDRPAALIRGPMFRSPEFPKGELP